MAQSRALTNAQVIRAALIVLFGFLASGVLGFVRTGVLNAQFGTSIALDAFYAAQRIPEIIFVLVAGGALGSSFIPIYASQREKDPEQAWQLASAVMTLSTLAATALSLLVVVFAPVFSRWLLPGATVPEIQLTATLMRWMMITPIVFAISGLVMGILQSHNAFLLPSIAISMNPIGIIIGALVIAPKLPPLTGIAQVGANNVYGLAAGAVLSAVLHLLVQLPALLTLRARLRILPNWRVEGVMRVLRLMLPRVLGLGVVQINFLVNIVLTSTMITGSLVALNTAFTLMFSALGIIGQSVGSAVFPTLSTLYAEGDLDAFRDRLASAMRNVLFLAYPATVAFMVFGEPLVSVFEFGEWTRTDTIATAWALAFYAVGIAGFALLEILSRAFYAMEDTWTPVLIGIGAIVTNIILSLVFVRIIGVPDDLTRGAFAGLALANALTTLVEALILWWLISRRINGVNNRAIAALSWRGIIAAIVMGVLLWGMNQALPYRGVPLAISGILVGGGAYFLVSIVLGIDEARAVPNTILRRFKRS